MRKRHDGQHHPFTPERAGTADVSRETLARLETYAGLLLHWNRTINLVGRADRDLVWQRHIRDSLRLLPFLPATAGGCADLGSGAGLPGLVLAIATGRPFHLVEADGRKAAFLAEAARQTATPVSVHASRIEATVLPPLALVTARALAPLPKLIGLAAPLLQADGECLFLKGNAADAEIAEARTTWQFECERLDAGTDDGAGPILRIRHIRPLVPPA